MRFFHLFLASALICNPALAGDSATFWTNVHKAGLEAMTPALKQGLPTGHVLALLKANFSSPEDLAYLEALPKREGIDLKANFSIRDLKVLPNGAEITFANGRSAKITSDRTNVSVNGVAIDLEQSAEKQIKAVGAALQKTYVGAWGALIPAAHAEVAIATATFVTLGVVYVVALGASKYSNWSARRYIQRLLKQCEAERASQVPYSASVTAREIALLSEKGTFKQDKVEKDCESYYSQFLGAAVKDYRRVCDTGSQLTMCLRTYRDSSPPAPGMAVAPTATK